VAARMIWRRRMSMLALCALAVLAVGTGISIVAAKHEARQLFAELEALNREQDRLQIDWGRLQLEQSTYATHSLVESKARDRLGFGLPRPDAIVIVREPPQ
jgi:cell division protein FtsL